MKLGLISDTHGLLRPEAVVALRGCELILHAGDIGNADVLRGLAALAPVIAVRGNNDVGAWARVLPDSEMVTADGRQLHLLHDIKDLALDPVTAGIHAVISGHSHKPSVERRDGVLFINPGSAGPRRFKLPVSLARLTIENGLIEARIIPLA